MPPKEPNTIVTRVLIVNLEVRQIQEVIATVLKWSAYTSPKTDYKTELRTDIRKVTSQFQFRKSILNLNIFNIKDYKVTEIVEDLIKKYKQHSRKVWTMCECREQTIWTVSFHYFICTA